MLTIHGGVTSHAAVVMRGMGKPAVTGASKLTMRAVPKEKAESAQVAAEGKSSEKAEVIKYFFSLDCGELRVAECIPIDEK